MGLPNSEIVVAIYHLLPGFIAAWIYYALTAHQRPTPFERVIQALIFTMFAEALVWFLSRFLIFFGSRCIAVGIWTNEAAFAFKVVTAIAIGFVFATLANSGAFHKFIPECVSKRTSFPSEWFSAFSRTKKFVYLQLKDQRRIYGWPEEWPDEPGVGHFVLTNAEWILTDNTRIPLIAIERILVPASEIEFVEFEKNSDELDRNADQIVRTSKEMISYNSSSDDQTESEK